MSHVSASTVAVIEAHGHKYALDIEPDSHIGRQIHERGEPYEAKLLEHMSARELTWWKALYEIEYDERRK